MKKNKTLQIIITGIITASLIASCADTTDESEPSIPESSIEESVTETTEATTKATTQTTEETVYVYNGYYYSGLTSELESKTGVESMLLSEAKENGYIDSTKLTEDEKTAYDYNLAWEMVAQGKSDEEIVEALCTQGYSNEGAAQFMVSWVREDYANGIRAYEAPQNTSGNTGSSSSSSGSSSSGSGSSGSSGSGSSGSSSSGGSSSGGSSSGGSSSSGGNSGSGNSGGGTSETQAPAPTETQALAPTETQAPAQTEPAPTSPPPTETQAPTPTPQPQITGYTLTGTAFTDGGNGDRVTLTFTGSSKDDVRNQFYTYCEDHNYQADGYSIATNYG